MGLANSVADDARIGTVQRYLKQRPDHRFTSAPRLNWARASPSSAARRYHLSASASSCGHASTGSVHDPKGCAGAGMASLS